MLKFDQDPKTDGGHFIKLDDGASVIGILTGEVKTFYVLWDNGKSTECDENTPKAKFRFRVNLATIDTKGNMVPKILEMGPTVYKTLKELSNDYDLEQTVIKIKRTGMALNTEYSVLPLPKKPSEETLKKLVALELLSLESEQKEDTANDNSGEHASF